MEWRRCGVLPPRDRERVVLGLLCLLLPVWTEGRVWSVQQVLSLSFPYQSSDDLSMDVCKAAGYIGDIALNEAEVRSLRLVNATMKRLRNGEKTSGGDLNEWRSRNIEKLEKQLKLMDGRRGRRGRRAATARKERIWDNGVIPYEIQANFSGEHKALFKKAMRHWENHTCISFVERTPEDENYIVFTVADCGCCSFVGKRGDGPQAISIGKNCDKFGIVVHELGHVVGFWHEHTRPDRDQFVDIYYKNIQQGQDYNFEKLKNEDVDSLGEPYDFASIMHYARDTFARAMYMDTILPKPDHVTRERPDIGQRIRLSPGDVRQANALYQCPRCGETLMVPSGKLFVGGRVGGGVGTPRPVQCEWRVVATQGEKILLNISSLRLPPSPDCPKEQNNYLVIRDGHYVESKLIQKFCGESSGAVTVKSSGNRLWVEFRHSPPLPTSPHHKDPNKELLTKPPPLLQATYKVVCGGEIVSDEGIVQSPNYPDDYRSDQDCVWYITVPANYQVALKFQLFQLEQHNECIYDRLEVFDGHEEGASLIGKYCGYTLPGNVKSTSNKMKVRFFSDNSVEKAGFAMQFVKEFDECQTGNHGCQHKCVNTLGGFKCDCEIGYELHIDGKSCEDACGGYIKAENGTLTSPNFPQLYPASKRCIWEIEAHPQYRITLNFTHFDMEGINRNCEYDFVKVRSVGGEGEAVKMHGSYCGRLNPPFVLTSETNRLRVEFSSDTSVQKSGFAAVFFTDRDECDVNNGGCEQICRNTIGSYKCECESGYVLAEDERNCKEGGCKYEVNAPNGRVSSPNYPHEYPNKKECVWHFVTTPGHRLQLSFAEFDVEPHSSCRYDRVELYDGSSPSAPVLGSYCGTKIPDQTTSSNNELFMLFITDPSVNRNGFKATYTSVCGGALQADHSVGFIYSHAKYGGSDYEHKMECEWEIVGKVGWGVSVVFTSFALEEEINCDYDYVQIHDGFGKTATDFGRFCAKQIPPEFISTGGAMRLVFKTDDTVEKKGFVAEYKLTELVEGMVYTPRPRGPTTPHPLEPVINERDKFEGSVVDESVSDHH